MEIILLLENTTEAEAQGFLSWHRDKQAVSERPAPIELAYDPVQKIYVLIKVTNPHDLPDRFTNEDCLRV
jgi:hypothetical protein